MTALTLEADLAGSRRDVSEVPRARLVDAAGHPRFSPNDRYGMCGAVRAGSIQA